MAHKKPIATQYHLPPDWDDSWESDVALVEPSAPESLKEILPLREGAWTGERFQVPAELACGTLVRRQIQSLATDRSMSPDDTADLVLAVSEAFNNAVRHGTAGPDEPIEFSVQIADGTASIQIRYLGEPFPAGEPALPPATSTRGRGRYIMAMLLDDIHYQFDPPWTALQLVKRYEMLPAPPLSNGSD
jgi:anti-sigma regulatory factor (Ser/Thr protein kinase)